MQPLRRNARMTEERVRRWPLAVATGSVVVIAASVLFLRVSAPRPNPTCANPPDAPATIVADVAVVADVATPDEAETPVADDPRVARGRCSVNGLSPALVQKTTDAEAAELARLVSTWMTSPNSYGDRPTIFHPRGVLYVESEEDRGDDGPYPRSAAPEAERVCGSAASWLRSHLRERIGAYGGLSCSGNACCYGSSEYSPSGWIVFRRHTIDGETEWALDAWIQLYDAALGAEVVEDNTRHVRTSLARLADTRCPGEPDRAD